MNGVGAWLMEFPVKERLSSDDIESGLSALVKNGVAAQAMATLTGGIFLVAFALELGASNVLIGVLAALPSLVQLLQIPSIYLVEKVRNRRAIAVWALLGNRLGWLAAVLIPFLFVHRIGIFVLLLVIFNNSVFAAVANCSWTSWVRDLVPQERLGSFFGRRISLCVGVDLLFTLAAGLYLDYWKRNFPELLLYGFSLMFFVGLLLGMVGLLYLAEVPEPEMTRVERRFSEMLLRPLRDVNFRNLIVFLGSWNFAVNLAAPFFTVYMLKTLGMEMIWITGLLVLSQVMNLLFTRVWGHVSDRFSNKSVLGMCGPLFIVCILAWTFTTMPDKHALTTPLLIAIHIFMGIATAGVALATWNIGLKLAPKGEATSYLATANLVNALAAGIAPIFGGVLADFFVGRELSWTIHWTSPVRDFVFRTLNFEHWDFLFFFAFVLGIYSIHRLVFVKEVGEVEEKVVLHELLSEAKMAIRNFSTAAGLRFMVHFPFLMSRSWKKESVGPSVKY